MALLEGHGLSKRFGGVMALDQVSFSVEEGTIVGLIGPNGAGKTTLFNVVAGALKPDSGQILFDDDEITGMPADRHLPAGPCPHLSGDAAVCLHDLPGKCGSGHDQQPADECRQQLA